MTIILSFIYFFFILVFTTVSCSNAPRKSESTSYEDIPQKSMVTEPQDSHLKVSDRTIFYEQNIPSATAFIVISKKYTDLSVYAPIDKDTVLVARYPVCLGRKPGQKKKNGDMRTPECSLERPFLITQIQNSSDWHYDFGDERGPIKAYGNWFLRLSTPPHSGIGIHGSTNNESSVPGRDSEGCIRMRDADIIHLKENYAYKGMRVVVTQEEQDILPFEKNVVVKYKNVIREIKKDSCNKEIMEIKAHVQ